MLARYLSKRAFSRQVYLWSSSTRLGRKQTDIKTQFAIPTGVPTRAEFFKDMNVSQLRIGLRHSAAISGDGLLYMFGNGNWGVLGQGNEDNVGHDSPVLVKKFESLGIKVVDVALGEYHSMALTEDGNVWTWGYGGKKGFFNWMYSQEVGALGLGDKESHFVPQKVQYFEENGIKIASISAGLYHCNAVDTEGRMYSWGRGVFGVLGNGSNQYSLDPWFNEDLDSIAEGEGGLVRVDAADEYSVAQLGDGGLYTWGKNDRGQCGTGPGMGVSIIESEPVPTPIGVIND